MYTHSRQQAEQWAATWRGPRTELHPAKGTGHLCWGGTCLACTQRAPCLPGCLHQRAGPSRRAALICPDRGTLPPHCSAPGFWVPHPSGQVCCGLHSRSWLWLEHHKNHVLQENTNSVGLPRLLAGHRSRSLCQPGPLPFHVARMWRFCLRLRPKLQEERQGMKPA